MRILSSRSRPLPFLILGMAVALCLVARRSQSPWNLLADEVNPPQTFAASPEVPFELLYSRKGSVYRNLRHAVESDDEARAMALVQSILDDSEDHFVSTESGRVLSLKQLSLDYLESLPKSSLREYQRQWDLDADVLLEEARESGKVSDYAKILDRYYFTNSGFEAIDWLAMRSLDLGQFHTASRLWNNVIDSNVHAHRVGPQLLLKAAVANRLAGDGERAAELMTTLVRTKTGQELSLKLQNYLKSQADNVSREESEGHSELVESWEMSLAENLSAEERDLLDEWRQSAWGDRKILSVARSAVVEGRLLAIRDYNRILLMDRITGKPQASYRVSPSLDEAVEEYERKQFIANQWERFESRAEFLEKFVWNTLHSQLTHDRRHVYVVEKDDEWKQNKRPNANPNSQRDDRDNRFQNPALGNTGTDPIPANRLVALPLKEMETDEITDWAPVWEITAWDAEHPEFEGVYFLSPPVNVDGVLYAVVEQDETIKLFCLDPSNGKLLWSQGIGFPMENLFEDSSRKWRGCVIKAAGDKLILTTQVGLVVGIDPVRRVLEWVYYLGESRTRRQFAFRGRALDFSYGSLGFVDEPMISGRKMFLLPRQSSELHCLDLESGRLLWKKPRNKPAQSSDESLGDEYLGGVYRNVLLVVGARETRGVSAEDGQELWRFSHSRISGHGVQQDESYLLPLENSKLLRIQIFDGMKQVLNVNPESDSQQVSLSGIAGDQSIDEYPAPLPEFGHLFVADRHLISLGIDSLVALPEPGGHLEALKVLAATGQLDAEQRLEFITLNSELTSSERIDQFEQFEQLLSEQLPDTLKARVEDEYEQELFGWLWQHPEKVAIVAEKLNRFQKTSEDQIRLAIHLSIQQMELGDTEGVLKTLMDLGRLQSEELFEHPGDTKLLVSQGAWMRTLWDWSRNQENRDRFDSYLAERTQHALTSDDSAEMRKLLGQLPGLPELDNVRIQLSRKALQEQRFHEAEMLYLTVLQHREDGLAATAMVELASLWSRFRLHDRAAAMLKQADSILADSWPDDLNAQRIEIQNSMEMRKTVSNLMLPSDEISQVTLNSLLPGPPQRKISESYEGYRRIYPTPAECDFDLLAKSHPDPSENNKHMLHVVSRSKGTVSATVPLPLRGSAGASSRDSVVGHFFPFGSTGQIRGLSLMDTSGGGPGWTRSFLDPEMGEMLFVGPFSSEFASFRHRDAMIVVDSVNGKVIWRRDELEAQESSSSNPRLIMFGDERVIARRSSNEARYEVYETFTGQQIKSPEVPRSGELGAVGRLLVMLRYSGNSRDSNSTRQPSVSVVDMETGTEVFASRYWSPHCSHLDGDHLVLIDHEKQLRVIDLKARKEIVSIPTELGEIDSVTRLNYWSDAANHYINIRRVDDHQRVREEGGDRIFSNFASNPFLPTTDVVGLLIAVDKQTGRRRWDRIMSSCSVVQSPHEALPFLTMLSWRVQQRVPNTRRLHVEVLSLDNGRTLGLSDDFVPLDQFMQLFQSKYDREAGRLELNGPMYRVQIDFHDRWNRFLPEPGPS